MSVLVVGFLPPQRTIKEDQQKTEEHLIDIYLVTLIIFITLYLYLSSTYPFLLVPGSLFT